jgi:hypothetical protein
MSRKHGRQTQSPEKMQEEVVKLYADRARLGEALVNKFGKTDVFKESIDKIMAVNPKKAGRSAIALHNQEKVLKQIIRENVYSTTFGSSVRPEHMLKAVFLGSANSHRGDIFTEYPLTSTDDALFYIQATYEQNLRGTTAGQRSYENIKPFYSGEEYYGSVGTGDGGTLTFTSGAMSPLTLIPWTIRITVAGAIVGADNGSGTLVGATLDTSGTNTVDYTNGIITVTFSAGNAPALGAAIAVSYQWNSELSTNYTSYGTMALELIKTRFNARPMPIGYRISDMTQIMFETTGLGDAKDYLAQAIAQEHARARDYRAIARARQIALSNATATFDTDFAAAGEISFKSHAQRLLNEIERVGAVIYDDIKRGGITQVVAGAKATTYAKNHDLWTDDTSEAITKNGLYKAGKLSNIDVYTCPADSALVATNEMMLVYKNPVECLDTSMVCGTLTEIDSSLRYPNFITEGNSCTVEDIKQVNGKFIRLLTLSSLS